MAGLDLGFSSFEHATAIIANEQNRSLSHIWMCDWEILSFIDKIDFVCDATMYRMYCAEFGIECDYNDEECLELAQKYKDQIFKFQRNLIKNIVVMIYDRWTGYVRSGVVVPSLPPSAKTALINFMNIVKRMSQSEYAPHFIGMFSSLAEAHKEPSTYTYDVSDVQETISSGQFESYCQIMQDRIMKPFQSEDELELKRFNTRISMIQKILMSILWMCEPEHYNKIYDSDAIFDKYMLPYIQATPCFSNWLKMFMNRKSMPMAYAVCVTPETVELIPEDQDTYPITDSIRLVLTLALVNTGCAESE